MTSMNNLREYRIKQLMTQKRLAEKSGVDQVTISFIENQLSNPMDKTKQKLARALGVDQEVLFPSKSERLLRR